MATSVLLLSRSNQIKTDLFILAAILVSISIFAGHADIVLLLSWLLVALYTSFTHRNISFIHLILSTIIAICWVYIARENYGYNHKYITVSDVNILPVLAWSLGLLGVSEIFNHFRSKSRVLNFILFIPVFWFLLLLIETYAFHVIEIRDTMSGNTIGLPFCNCLHAPWWMRIVYFSLGPAYYALTLLADFLFLRYTGPIHKPDQ